MTRRDLFSVTWQGGGGWGDPIERDIDAVARDVTVGAVSREAARTIYGVIVRDGGVDTEASRKERRNMREQRAVSFATDPEKFCKAGAIGSIGEALWVARDERGTHVVTTAGYILATGHTRWRPGAVARTYHELPPEYRITLHEGLCVTAYYCPASGTLLALDVHERAEKPPEDAVVDLMSLERLWQGEALRQHGALAHNEGEDNESD
jgi:N-methylhydantoinase B